VRDSAPNKITRERAGGPRGVSIRTRWATRNAHSHRWAEPQFTGYSQLRRSDMLIAHESKHHCPEPHRGDMGLSGTACAAPTELAAEWLVSESGPDED